MLKLEQILYFAIKSTNRSPRWWILSLLQIICLSVIGKFSRLHLINFYFAPLILGALILLVVVTVYLWLEMEALKMSINREVKVKVFFAGCLTVAAIIFLTVVLIMFSRFIFGLWVILVLISSLLSATAVLSMLYAVLCGQNLQNSFKLALDTWHKNNSLIAIAAIILMLSHGVSFALVHGIWGGITLSVLSSFSVSSFPATIWIMLLVLACFISYFSAVLNSFLVFLFLEIINRKKDPESLEVEQTSKAPVLEGNI